MKPLSTLLLLGLLIFTTSGCVIKDDSNPVGPIGNADIFSLNFNFNLRQAEISDDGLVSSTRYDVSDITPSVVDEGTVLVYYRFAGTWTALPYTISVEAPDDPPRVDYSATFSYGYDDNRLDVFVEASTSDPVVWEELEAFPLFDGGTQMKAVIIDSLPIAAKQGTLDLRDYEAVKAYYGLED